MNETTAPSAFPVTPRNRVKRMHERGSYDREAVWAVLDAGMLAHLAYTLDGQPGCTPTLYWREGDRILWHGSSASRMLRGFEQGAPVCLTVSHLDGLVLARSGFHHSVNYRSAMCFGVARPVEGEEERKAAMRALIDRFYPGRNDAMRPMLSKEIKATRIVAMTIEDASVKVRAATVGDDEEDYSASIWAGVIPLRTVVGEEEPCPRIRPESKRGPDLAVYRPGRRFDEALLEAQALYEALD